MSYHNDKTNLTCDILSILHCVTLMINNDKDKNQPYGKLRWLEIVTLLGVLSAATIFILFYFSQ
jgi:hypothetical protein